MSNPNERLLASSEASQEPEVEGHRYAFATESDEGRLLETEEPEVEGHSIRPFATEEPDERLLVGTEPPA